MPSSAASIIGSAMWPYGPQNADQACVRGRKLVGAELQTIDLFSERGVDETLVGEASQQRRLPAARESAALGHIGGLVPAEHRSRRVEIVNLRQPVLQVGQNRVGRLPVSRAFDGAAFGVNCVSEPVLGCPGLPVAAHASLVMNFSCRYTRIHP